jgi:hypothetical protein
MCNGNCSCKKDFKPAAEGEKHVCCSEKPKQEEKKGCDSKGCGCAPKPSK